MKFLNHVFIKLMLCTYEVCYLPNIQVSLKSCFSLHSILCDSIFQNDKVPGLLFFLNAGIMFISALLCLMFEETKDHVLEDALHKQDVQQNGTSIKQQSATVENGIAVTGKEKLNDKHELYGQSDPDATSDTKF